MQINRRTTSTAGAFVLVGMLAGVLSVVPVLENPGYLTLIPTHQPEILRGAAAQALMIPAYVGFALCLYPTLKRGGEALSLGFVGFRLIAATFHLAGVILLPLFLTLSASVPSGDPHPAQMEVLGEMLRSGRDLVNHVALIIALGISDLLLFRILHRWKLVPRWLTTWGFLGAGLTLAASFMVLVDLTGIVTPLYLGMNAPLAAQSLVLALWLISRGLDTTTLEPEPTPQTVV
jgi:hypothetical protein